MCLITHWKNPRTAKKDIVCYKILQKMEGTDTLRSLFMLHYYSINKRYSTVMKDSLKSEYTIVYDRDVDYAYPALPNIVGNLKQYNLRSIASGFHSFTARKREAPRPDDREVLVECVIPKGSLYFKDKTGLMVSNSIVIKKII